VFGNAGGEWKLEIIFSFFRMYSHKISGLVKCKETCETMVNDVSLKRYLHSNIGFLKGY
jgi:hypothetical protein